MITLDLIPSCWDSCLAWSTGVWKCATIIKIQNFWKIVLFYLYDICTVSYSYYCNKFIVLLILAELSYGWSHMTNFVQCIALWMCWVVEMFLYCVITKKHFYVSFNLLVQSHFRLIYFTVGGRWVCRGVRVVLLLLRLNIP